MFCKLLLTFLAPYLQVDYLKLCTAFANIWKWGKSFQNLATILAMLHLIWAKHCLHKSAFRSMIYHYFSHSMIIYDNLCESICKTAASSGLNWIHLNLKQLWRLRVTHISYIILHYSGKKGFKNSRFQPDCTEKIHLQRCIKR